MAEEMRVVCVGPANQEYVVRRLGITIEGANPLDGLEGKYDLKSILRKPMGDQIDYALLIIDGTRIVPLHFTVPSSGVWEQSAGSSLNVAMALRALEVRHVTLATSLAVGPHDSLSDSIRTYVADSGINLIQFPRPATAVTVVIVDGNENEKKSIALIYKPWYPISSTDLRTTVQQIFEREPTHIFATGIRFSELHLVHVAFRKARKAKKGIVTCFTPNSSILCLHPSELRYRLKQVALLVDVLQMNKSEAEVYLQRRKGSLTFANVRQISKKLKVPAFIVTRGAAGAWAVIEGRDYEIPAVDVPTVLDTTGAGDAFFSGFVVARHEGCSPEDALRIGASSGARNVMAIGGHGGMPPREQFDKYVASLPTPPQGTP